MSLQDLNDDILTIILSYLEPHDALPLTTTCRSLHFSAIKRLVSEYDVVYLDPSDNCMDRLLKFCDYMLAYPQHRPAYLKYLHLEVWKPVLHPLALNRLADVISHARALHTMSLYGDLNELGPSVMNAIVNADSLDCFRVDTDVPQMSLFSLSDVKFRPRVVTCLVDSSDPYTVTDPELIPKQLLNNIRELAIAGMLHIIEAMASHIVCPHVERLKIDDSTITAAQWDALMRTFPNVHTFRTTARSVPVFNTSASPYAGWSELDMVHALSPLPLRHCRVRRVELEIPMRQLPRCDLSPEMLDMLRCVSPVALTSWMNDELLDCVGRDLHSVNMLRLVKRADSKHVIPDATIGLVNHITDRVISTLASSDLRALLIDLCGIHFHGDTAIFFRPHAEAIASAIRTLHLVGMRFDWLRNVKRRPLNTPWDHDHRAWNVSHYQWYHVESREADGTPHLTTIDGEDVARVVPKLLYSFQFPSPA